MLARRLTTLLCAVGLFAAASASGATAAAGAYVYRLGVTGTTHGQPVPADFVGLAITYKEVPVLAGSQSVNPLFVRLLKNLDPSGRPSIRIGGQSADRAWWPVRGIARPRGITYDLNATWAADAHALAAAVDARYLLGINLEANRPRISQAEADRLVTALGRRYSDELEIGNEPDLYTSVPWYRRHGAKPLPWYSHDGTPVYARPSTYAPADFLREFSRTLKVVPHLPVAGPGTSSPRWEDAFDRLLSPRSRVRTITSHAYGLNQCVKDPAAPTYPSVAHMVSLVASRGEVSHIGLHLAAAHRNGAAFRIDEMGSVTCNAHRGVANTLASALWVLDALFTMAGDGVDGVNIHTFPGSANGLFDFSLVHGRRQTEVHPLYYGALMFTQAAPPGSRLLRVVSRSHGPLRAWATRAPDRTVRVLLINDSLTSPALAVVRPPVVPGPASLERLRASSAYATSGVTLGGRTFGKASSTAVLATPVPQSVAPRAGAYSVTLPAGSAALVTLGA